VNPAISEGDNFSMHIYNSSYSKNSFSQRLTDHMVFFENSYDCFIMKDTAYESEMQISRAISQNEREYREISNSGHNLEYQYIDSGNTTIFTKYIDEAGQQIKDSFVLADTLILTDIDSTHKGLGTKKIIAASIISYDSLEVPRRRIFYYRHHLIMRDLIDSTTIYILKRNGSGGYLKFNGKLIDIEGSGGSIFLLHQGDNSLKISELNLSIYGIQIKNNYKVKKLTKPHLSGLTNLFVLGFYNDSLYIYKKTRNDATRDSMILYVSIPVNSQQTTRYPWFIPGSGNEFWVVLYDGKTERQSFIFGHRKNSNSEFEMIRNDSLNENYKLINFNGNEVRFITDSAFYTLKNGKIISCNSNDSSFSSIFGKYILSMSLVYGESPVLISYNSGNFFLAAYKKEGGDYSYKIFGDKLRLPNDSFEATRENDPYIITILIAFATVLYFLGNLILRDLIQLTKAKASEAYLDKIPSLKRKIRQIEQIADNLKMWSNTMLGLGIVFGVGGLVTFYIVIGANFDTTQKYNWNDANTVINLLRPTLLLVFIETFTFFFLKQFRVIFNEYKLFYSVYLRLYNYFHLIEIEPGEVISDNLLKIIIEKLKDEKFDLYESNKTVQIQEFDNAAFVKVLDKVLDKIK
jgi:hypothetical protein